MSHKPVVLIFTFGYLPGFKAGGPIRSIVSLVGKLSDRFDFRIITSDRDLGDSSPYSDVKQNQWQLVGTASVFYASPSALKIVSLKNIINSVDYDLLYFNSFFSLNFTIKPLLLKLLHLVHKSPAIIAPRGEFSPGALAFKKKKKRIFIILSRIIGLYKDLIWQASSDIEARHISCNVRNGKISKIIPIVIAPDLIKSFNSSVFYNKPKKTPGKLEIVFLSRISPMKNLDGALRILEGVVGNVRFNIYGPIEDRGYFEYCMHLAGQLKPSIDVVYKGEVSHESVFETFSSHHLFLLPTHGENFGHVILESLLAGCPVLVSDQTPWRELKQDGVGWDVSLDDFSAFQAIINECVAMDDKGFKSISSRAHEYGLRACSNNENVSLSGAMFMSALNGTED